VTISPFSGVTEAGLASRIQCPECRKIEARRLPAGETKEFNRECDACGFRFFAYFFVSVAKPVRH
jgi:predicted RNA-binding Zn-ribbon protein involved in translation (DUF1610 family)